MSTVVGLLANFQMTTFGSTPGGKGLWEDVRFVLNPTEPCDYIIIRNRASVKTEVICPPEHVWVIMQEPPNEVWQHWHKSFPVVKRVFTQDVSKVGPRYVHSHPALPWHVGRDYDYLKACPPVEKTRDLSWITSNLNHTAGHQRPQVARARAHRQMLGDRLVGDVVRRDGVRVVGKRGPAVAGAVDQQVAVTHARMELPVFVAAGRLLHE